MTAPNPELFKDIYPYNLAENYYSRIGNRHNALGQIPFFDEQPDKNSRLFPIEEHLSADLLSACYEYMSHEDIGMVHTALAMSLSAHQSQYRDSGDPYSTHVLNVALPLAQKYKLDAVTIAAALLHDTIEDTEITLDIIQRDVSPEVAATVDALSQIKGSKQRKDIIDEQSRLKIINSLLDNPRVAIIKIFDRLHNMRTLQTKKGRTKRMAIIHETHDIYVPLAQRLGLFEEAKELDDLGLVKRSQDHEKLASRIQTLRAKFVHENPSQLYVNQISKMTNIPTEYFRVRTPSLYDIYRQVGEKREVGINDFYYQVDIVLPGVYQRTKLKGSASWGEIAMGIETMLNFSEDYILLESVDERQFKREIEDDMVDSLTFDIRHREIPARLRINIFPEDAYEREITQMTDLYYFHEISEAEKTMKALPEDVSDEIRRHLQGYSKYVALRRRFQMVREEGPLAGETGSAHILRFLEPRLPTGFIRVIGVDDKNNELPWPVKEGSTILDYAKDIFQQKWTNTQKVWVNKPDNIVPLNYVLKPGDRVHIVFSKKSTIHPSWIYAFRTDVDGAKEVRTRIKRLMARQLLTDKGESMLQQLFIVGKWRIEQDLDPDNRPLRVGLARAKDKYQEFDPEITEGDFYLKVGYGEVRDDIIKEVAAKLADPNRNVGHFTVTFDQNASGQALSVLQSVVKVNLLDMSTPTFGESQSHVELYIDPDDTYQAKYIIRSIINSPECRRLGLKAVSYKDPKIALSRKVRSKSK